MKLAERMSRIGTESAFEVLARARALEAQGKDIIHLEIGQPDFPTPAHIKEAAKRALDDGFTGYGPTAGLPELREAIASYVSRTRAIPVSAANVCVVPGGKPIMYFVMTALLEPGDEVIYPNPGFPIYESLVDFLGATRVPMPLIEDRGFSFDLDRFEQSLSPRTKLVVLNSPGNPTGGVIPKQDLKRIADLVRDRDLLVLSEHDLGANMRRILAASGQKAPDAKPALELNVAHPLVRYLDSEGDVAQFGEVAQLLYDQAALAEGGQLANPADYVQRLNRVLVRLTGAPAGT